MSEPSFYGPQHRALQDQFGTRSLADRLSYTTTPTFDEFSRSFVERCDMFFLATVDHEDFASHVRGVVGQEIRGGMRDLLRPRETAQRNRSPDSFGDPLVGEEL